MTDELSRIAQPPRTNRALMFGMCATAVIATAVITTIAMTPTDAPAPPPPPEPKAAAPVVIPIAAPQLVVLQAPAAPPPPAPEVPEPPPPRAAAPFIQIACMLDGQDGEAPASCSWDHGFPAISADGKTLAVQRHGEDGGRGYPGLSIQLLDVATSRVKRTVMVLDPDEYVPSDDPKAPALRRKVEQRADVAQRLLDAGAYRALAVLGGSDAEPMSAAGLRAEFDAEVARVIDVASNTVVWQRRFSVAREFPDRKPDPDVDSCVPIHTRGMTISWDAQTRTILAEVSYGAGPCYCPDTTIDYVQHVR
jgi:hypothetical protein